MLWINREIAKIDAAIRDAADAANFTYIDETYNAFDGHELCNGRRAPWINRVVIDIDAHKRQQSYHPNASGQRALANLLSEGLN